MENHDMFADVFVGGETLAVLPSEYTKVAGSSDTKNQYDEI
ncbi:hypothetical protein [Saccharothrix algeriensis]|uniref:Uncharacterized protein n=1 Tax=Saccharothrix algeriensis TaxID=173560 RepID=A0ABS2S530_9PSEU|nr:hypothetical protein [Saccharothrix algeriensis]MBM7810221.1 hypothetical protein [Saccharothrix algeriensis]